MIVLPRHQICLGQSRNDLINRKPRNRAHAISADNRDRHAYQHRLIDPRSGRIAAKSDTPEASPNKAVDVSALDPKLDVTSFRCVTIRQPSGIRVADNHVKAIHWKLSGRQLAGETVYAPAPLAGIGVGECQEINKPFPFVESSRRLAEEPAHTETRVKGHTRKLRSFETYL